MRRQVLAGVLAFASVACTKQPHPKDERTRAPDASEPNASAPAPDAVSAAALAACPNPAWCIANVTKPKLDAALAALAAWEQQEKQRPYFSSPETGQLPLDGVILAPKKLGLDPATGLYGNAWGKAHIVYAIRRGAYFTAQLFPELKAITVLRLDTSHPVPANPTPGDVHLKGTAADIGYLLTGDGTDTRASVDVERCFWFTWAVWQTGWAFEQRTDFQEEILAYRDLAVAKGLIPAASYPDQAVIQDSVMNHDTHIHIGVN